MLAGAPTGTGFSLTLRSSVQMMDTMCVKVQDHLNSLAFSQDRTVREDMKAVENLMTDARNSKTVGELELRAHVGSECNFDSRFFPLQILQLLPSLYRLEGDRLRGAIRGKLESVAAEVAAVMDEELEVGTHRKLISQVLVAAMRLACGICVTFSGPRRRCWRLCWKRPQFCVLT